MASLISSHTLQRAVCASRTINRAFRKPNSFAHRSTAPVGTKCAFFSSEASPEHKRRRRRTSNKSVMKSMIEEEETRRQRMEDIRFEAQENGSHLELKVGSVIERLPVIMPDLEEWEVDFLEFSEKARRRHERNFPTSLFRMLDKGQADMEPWVYDVLSRGTSRTGPFARDENLKQEIQAMAVSDETEEIESLGDGVEVKEISEEERLASLDDGWDDSGGQDDWEIDIEETEETSLKRDDFKPAPRVTEADKNMDVKSLDRALSKRLYLIVKQKNTHALGTEEFSWRFPEAAVDSGEEGLKMREHAEMNIKNVCEDLDLHYVGNAPAGFINYVYCADAKASTSAYGASLFFYRAQLLEGDTRKILDENKNIQDYAWITAEEISNFVDNVEEDEYWSFASKMLEK